MVPESCARKPEPGVGALAPDVADDELAPDVADDEADADDLASSDAGVPARLAQPAASGPLGSQSRSASGAAIDASTAEARIPE
jgi:hypothetical protein